MIEKLLELHPQATTLLDIGCGIGASLLEGTKLGLTCTGMDRNPFAYEYAKKHYDLDIEQGYFAANYFDKKFDLVILDNVLEHVPHPREFLRDIFDTMNPSGLLYLIFPGNKGGLARLLFSLVFHHHRYSIFRANDVHINHFFRKSTGAMLAANKASVIYHNRVGSYIVKKG